LPNLGDDIARESLDEGWSPCTQPFLTASTTPAALVPSSGSSWSRASTGPTHLPASMATAHVQFQAERPEPGGVCMPGSGRRADFFLISEDPRIPQTQEFGTPQNSLARGQGNRHSLKIGWADGAPDAQHRQYPWGTSFVRHSRQPTPFRAQRQPRSSPHGPWRSDRRLCIKLHLTPHPMARGMGLGCVCGLFLWCSKRTYHQSRDLTWCMAPRART